jgi:hypothetical protein
VGHPSWRRFAGEIIAGSMVDDRREDLEQERPRPRVVDKRVSSRPPSETPPPTDVEPAPQPETPPQQPRSPEVAPPPQAPAATGEPSPGSPVWTPEQEEQAQRIAEELARTPGKDLVVTFAMNFVEVASVKLEAGDLEGAQLAIDAFSGILSAVGPRLGDAEGPMRSVLAQLQMAYAQRAAAPPQPS